MALTLGQHQEIFSQHAAQLILKAADLGFGVRLGEALRTPEQQKLYFNSGASKTMNSQHLKKLAIDLNLIIDGRMATAKEIAPLGKWWESLDPLNRWGGSWRGLVESGQSSFIDSPHFERLA
jgi:hypothetical protein